MSNLPITIQMGALPASGKWTPQELADLMVARMSLVTAATFALFVTGATEPSSNVGPWLKNGNEWYVWNSSTGDYQPITISQESLGYFIGAVAPNPLIYQFWIETTAGGSPLSVKIFYSGSWVDVYAAQLASYQTIAAFNAAIANYSTTAQMNAAIAAAVGGINSYPAQANLSVPQSIQVDSAVHIIQLNQALINPSSNFDITTYRYTATVGGFYFVSASLQVDNNTGVVATMEMILTVYKNGVATSVGIGANTPSPNGSRWFPAFGGLMISLAPGDYIDLRLTLDDGTNTGAVDVSNSFFSVSKVP